MKPHEKMEPETAYEQTRKDDSIGVAVERDSELDAAVLDCLKLGVLEKLLPDLRKSQQALAEMTENQRILIETVSSENAKFGECQSLTDVSEIMEKAKFYHGKLVAIKKDMISLHEKSANLKKRALKLQQQRQKQALHQEQVRERELEKERLLVAKPTSKKNSSNKSLDKS